MTRCHCVVFVGLLVSRHCLGAAVRIIPMAASFLLAQIYEIIIRKIIDAASG
ncbi:hypothetical protein [Metabacillus sp. Hm71]|uniref:hypothetical protein n=1 Tax=Metabacillus sp. Hm71 TaxID=3450743 RepID=UPI003F444053